MIETMTCGGDGSGCATGPAMDWDAEFQLYDGDSDDFGRPVAHGRDLFVVATSRKVAIDAVLAFADQEGATAFEIEAWPALPGRPYTSDRAAMVGCD